MDSIWRNIPMGLEAGLKIALRNPRTRTDALAFCEEMAAHQGFELDKIRPLASFKLARKEAGKTDPNGYRNAGDVQRNHWRKFNQMMRQIERMQS